ncbi:hypothetical protein [Bifidobacterium subtile]|jgi:hypothetical protein|uniref:hypothetical protein n=1 Tax=Bifidobacterium subtile TaxID=77635 RepID=UPI002F3595B6
MVDQIVDKKTVAIPGPIGKTGEQGEHGVQGLPGVNAVSNDTAVATYLGTAGVSATKSALQAFLSPLIRVLAASDSSTADKAMASVVCDGSHDEAEIQAAIDQMGSRSGTVWLCQGTYNLDAFTGTTCKAALRAAETSQHTVRIMGPGCPTRVRGYDGYKLTGTAILNITPAAVDQLGTTDLAFGFTGIPADQDPDSWVEPYPGRELIMDGIGWNIPDNLHNITVMDSNAFTMQRITRVHVGNMESHDTMATTGSAQRCIGFRGAGAQKYGVNQHIEDCSVFGCRFAFDVGSEHLMMLNCGALWNWCGYRIMGTDQTDGGHPFTIINCLDEYNIVGPIFGGSPDIVSWRPIPGGTIIDYNMEVINDSTSRWNRIRGATESPAGTMRGFISYQISDGNAGFTSSNRIPFWEPGTHGNQCQTVNTTLRKRGVIEFPGMPESEASSGDLIPTAGVNRFALAFAQNASLTQAGYNSGGNGEPVWYDGGNWRTFDGMLATRNLLMPWADGSQDGFTWNAEPKGRVSVSVPAAGLSFKVVVLKTVTLTPGTYELTVPEANGLVYWDILFPDGSNPYQVKSGEPVQFKTTSGGSFAIRLNYTGNPPRSYAFIAKPYLRLLSAA